MSSFEEGQTFGEVISPVEGQEETPPILTQQEVPVQSEE